MNAAILKCGETRTKWGVIPKLLELKNGGSLFRLSGKHSQISHYVLDFGDNKLLPKAVGSMVKSIAR